MVNISTEIWKDIPNYIGLYQASNYGNIKSLKKKYGNNGNYKEIVLKPYPISREHLYVNLYKENKIKKYYIHRLILETFVGPCPLGMECRHLDGNPKNNRLENLKWGTHKENVQDSIGHGTSFNVGKDRKGSMCGASKLNEMQIRIILRLLEDGYLTQQEIGEIFGVAQNTISSIKLGVNWKHIKI